MGGGRADAKKIHPLATLHAKVHVRRIMQPHALFQQLQQRLRPVIAWHRAHQARAVSTTHHPILHKPVSQGHKHKRHGNAFDQCHGQTTCIQTNHMRCQHDQRTGVIKQFEITAKRHALLHHMVRRVPQPSAVPQRLTQQHKMRFGQTATCHVVHVRETRRQIGHHHTTAACGHGVKRPACEAADGTDHTQRQMRQHLHQPSQRVQDNTSWRGCLNRA